MQVGTVDTWALNGKIFASGTSWSKELIDHIRSVPYRVFRFQNWNGNGAQIVDGPDENWANRVRPREIRDGYRISYEDQIALCNAAKTDCWISVPAKSDRDPTYARNLAKLMLDKLDPSLKVYLEWSNESWNWGGRYSARYATERGQALGLPGDKYEAGFRYHACAASNLWAGFEEVFGKNSSRVVKLMAGQAANSWIAEVQHDSLKDPKCNPTGTMPNAYAIAPYMTGNTVGEMRGNLGATEEWLRQHKRIADAHGVALVAYEGGQHALSGADASSRDPAMYQLYLDYMTMLSRYMPLFLHYNLNQGPWGSGGAWGAVDVDFEHDSPKIRAIREWIRANPSN